MAYLQKCRASDLLNQNLHFNKILKGFVWTGHTSKCHRPKPLPPASSGSLEARQLYSSPYMYSSGDSRPRVLVKMRSPETSSLLLPPRSAPCSVCRTIPPRPGPPVLGPAKPCRVQGAFALRRLRRTHCPAR